MHWWCWRFRFGYPKYDLPEFSSNYFDSTGSFWFYSKDKWTNFNGDIANSKGVMRAGKEQEDRFLQFLAALLLYKVVENAVTVTGATRLENGYNNMNYMDKSF